MKEGRTMKKFILIPICAAMLLCAHTAFGEGSSGKCGDNAFWSYEDGTLTISGKGETYNIDRDYLSWEKPDWAEFEDEIENVVVEEGITSIGSQLFRGSSLKTVSLPHTLESIGYQSFKASALTSLTIPSTQTAVNVTSFENCRELAEITMPEELYTEAAQLFGTTLWYSRQTENKGMLILGDVFVGAGSVGETEEITVPEGVRIIAADAFNKVTARKVILPRGVEEICGRGFYCSDIKEVVLPDTLRSIGRRTFSNSSIERVTIPESVTSIDDYVFLGCKELREVYLPDSMTELPPDLFNYCGKLGSVHVSPRLEKIGAGAFYGCRVLTGFDFPETLTAIGSGAFRNAGLTSALLPDSVKEIGDHAFCYSGVREARLPSDIRSVPEGMFSGCGIDEITLPDTVEEIGDGAFSGCRMLQTINFPKSLKTIGSYAFSDCELLEPPEIPENAEAIGAAAFRGTAVKSVHVNAGIELGRGVYEGCKNLTEAVFEEGCEAVGASMFDNCTSLSLVSLPSTIKTIGSSAFMKCTALRKIDIPAGVNEIGELAFFGAGLHEINIPQGVKVIKSQCFEGCKSLGRAALPPGLEKISNNAFSGCVSLKEISIPVTVTEIDNGAFNNCTSLNKADLPPALTYVGHNTFGKCPLEEVYIPEGVTEIGDYSLNAAHELHIPPSVIKIGKGALPHNGIVYAQTGSYAYGFAVKQGITPIADYQRQVGDVVDHIVPSDIYVTMNGELIPSYCISGKTVVLLRDLERHGFDVWYDEVNKRANADFNAEKPALPGGGVWLANDEILYTDIVGVVNGTELECVNTNGYIGIEAERLGNYAPYISCVWQPRYRRLQMQAFEGMASFDDLVNAISDRKGIERGEGCASFADTGNSRYEVFANRGYISKADYNGYIYPMRGLRMSDFILTAGRAYYRAGLDYDGHASYGRGLYEELRGSYVPNYLTEYMNRMYDAGIVVPDENRSVYLDGILTREQMNYYLDVLDALKGE